MRPHRWQPGEWQKAEAFLRDHHATPDIIEACRVTGVVKEPDAPHASAADEERFEAIREGFIRSRPRAEAERLVEEAQNLCLAGLLKAHARTLDLLRRANTPMERSLFRDALAAIRGNVQALWEARPLPGARDSYWSREAYRRLRELVDLADDKGAAVTFTFDELAFLRKLESELK